MGVATAAQMSSHSIWCGFKGHVGVSPQVPPHVPILVNNSVTSRGAVVSWWPCLVLAPLLTSARSLFMHCIDSPMNVCYHSVQNLQSSTLLSKYTKIKIYRTVILPVVLMGVKLGHAH